jgi:hypothetical protein
VKTTAAVGSAALAWRRRKRPRSLAPAALPDPARAQAKVIRRAKASRRGDGVGSEVAEEAAALGNSDDHDETPALEYGEGDRPRGPTIGEALGSGAGTHVGSGTPPDRSGVGGGD